MIKELSLPWSQNNSMGLKEEIEVFVPFNDQEEQDIQELLQWMDTGLDLWTRENGFAHWTASAWVLNSTHDKVLMCYHNIYHSWSWLGGHADGNHDLLEVAIQEVEEEAGIHHVKPILNDIFSMEILTVDGHVKKGKYVSSHLHLNVTYLLEADENENLHIKEDENSGVAWFGLDEAIQKSSEPWFQEHIYTKLNAKLKKQELVK